VKYFIALYIAGWIFSVARLYYPSIRFLKSAGSDSALVKQEYLGWVVAIVGFGLTTPLTLPVALSDKLSKEFIVAFCDKALSNT
tara:strand:+ start:3234 stop:3485 length:252 start_codon:yes stop_codon:yes gene_type:complete